MRRSLIVAFLTLVISLTSFGFKEVMLNKGLEVGMGYVYSGFGIELGFERKLSDKIDIYPWLVFGGLNDRIGFGLQFDIPITVFKQDLFLIAVGPFVGMDLIIFNDNRTGLDFDLGGYGLFSFDFRKENVPISFTLGFGPNVSFSARPGFGVFYTVNISVYLGEVILQVGGNSKFAGLTIKIPSVAF